MKPLDYGENVFINCPFDANYTRLFRAIVFTIHSLGLRPRCALDTTNAENRIHKLFRIIRESKYGIHDISRIQLDKAHNLPRFNMPFELGLDIGCKELNSGYKDKKHLILETEPFRYQKFISDISGYDARSHGNKKNEVIQIVSDWLRTELNRHDLPNGKQIIDDYKIFEIDFAEAKKDLPKQPSFPDFSHTVAKWINKMRENKNSG